MPKQLKGKRAQLPGASELFRPTENSKVKDEKKQDASKTEHGYASGRIKHDEKITVYFSSEELFDLEDVRISLRRNHGLNIDRGRIVRAALAIALAEYGRKGEDSQLVRQLNQ